VFLLIQPVLSLVPFEPHARIYSLYIPSMEGKPGRQPETL
jgi:hypothetical protein